MNGTGLIGARSSLFLNLFVGVVVIFSSSIVTKPYEYEEMMRVGETNRKKKQRLRIGRKRKPRRALAFLNPRVRARGVATYFYNGK